MQNQPKKTPQDASEFEREQLSFLLNRENVAGVLAEINPSLAWLPILADMKLIKRDREVISWIEKNFADADAVREVAANSRFFSEESAGFLEFRLNQTKGLPPLLAKCWRLIIRHMRSGERGRLRNDWFEIAPRIKSGEQSPELLERIAQLLRPALRIGKRLSWHVEENASQPKKPSDLMEINYEIDEGVTGEEFLSAWPKAAAAETDKRLLGLLTDALTAALEDAIDAEVEGKRGYGMSDVDVPSVAEHRQNAYHSGFLPIVRVSAELWTRLAQKRPDLALEVLTAWRASKLRLIQRLALFAAADAAVPANLAADILLSLPQDELFLAGASVEVHRLLRRRWAEFSPGKRQAIENRAIEGPPADAFKEDADKDRVIDRCRFELLGDLERSGIPLGQTATAALTEIRSRWPQWTLRPEEQAGFHVWHEGGTAVVGDAGKLQGIADDQLIAAAEAAKEKAGFLEGDSWNALVQSDPGRALRGLAAQAKAGSWPVWFWHAFLWRDQKPQDAAIAEEVARLLLAWPGEQFPDIADAASWWLNGKAGALGETLLWQSWDRIEATAPREAGKALSGDALAEAFGAPAGRLAEILIKRLATGEPQAVVTDELRARFDRLVDADGLFGKLARVRLAADVSLLFERVPDWTTKRILPLFDWSSPDAAAAWAARSHARYIGSPALFDLTKDSFLELFGRSDLGDETVRAFAEWLATIIVANQSGADYPITGPEARQALRRAGVSGLASVGHRLAVEMEQIKAEDKVAAWRKVIGPAFEAMWPLDVELQSAGTTFKLVQILRAAGAAFPEAAAVIIPFIRPEDPNRSTSVFSIAEADDVLYASSPEKMLDLLTAAVNDQTPGAFGLRKALDRLRNCAPQLATSKKFQKLLSLAGQS